MYPSFTWCPWATPFLLHPLPRGSGRWRGTCCSERTGRNLHTGKHMRGSSPSGAHTFHTGHSTPRIHTRIYSILTTTFSRCSKFTYSSSNFHFIAGKREPVRVPSALDPHQLSPRLCDIAQAPRHRIRTRDRLILPTPLYIAGVSPHHRRPYFYCEIPDHT